MRNKRKKSKIMMYGIIFILLCVGFGFAALATNITITGHTTVNKNTWKVYVKSVTVDPGSVSADVAPVVPEGSTDTITLNYTFTLNTPKDYYMFDFVVKNDSTMDIMLSDDPTLEGLNGVNVAYILHSISTVDNKVVTKGDKILAGEEKTYRIRVQFRDDQNTSELPSYDNEEYLSARLNYVQYDSDYKEDGVTKLMAKANAGNIITYGDNKNEMYTFTNKDTANTPVQTHYRYIGSTPNNYIDFNGETWRILGVFPTDDGSGNFKNRIKIVKDSFLAEKKTWSTSSWESGTLDTYLNSNETTGYYYSLSDKAKSQIDEVAFYTKNPTLLDSQRKIGRGSDIYFSERSGESITRKVGLMYPSDYAYTFANGVDNKCYDNVMLCDEGNPGASWLFKGETEWLISPGFTDNVSALTIDFLGCVSEASISNTQQVRPTVYLKSDIKLTGDGTASNHYKIAD